MAWCFLKAIKFLSMDFSRAGMSYSDFVFTGLQDEKRKKFLYKYVRNVMNG